MSKTQLEKDMEVIAEICTRYGWQIAIPESDDEEDEVNGMILGTPEFLDSLIGDEEEKVIN